LKRGEQNDLRKRFQTVILTVFIQRQNRPFLAIIQPHRGTTKRPNGTHETRKKTARFSILENNRKKNLALTSIFTNFAENLITITPLNIYGNKKTQERL
jgi:hypothetical protein